MPTVATAELAFARTCYDHLAGSAGVAVFDAVIGDGWLLPGEEPLALTPEGERAFADLGVDLAACRSARRPLARECVDWTERRPHLAGALGAAMTSAMLDAGWWGRAERGRALMLTERGREQLAARFGLHFGGGPPR